MAEQGFAGRVTLDVLFDEREKGEALYRARPGRLYVPSADEKFEVRLLRGTLGLQRSVLDYYNQSGKETGSLYVLAKMCSEPVLDKEWPEEEECYHQMLEVIFWDFITAARPMQRPETASYVTSVEILSKLEDALSKSDGASNGSTEEEEQTT